MAAAFTKLVAKPARLTYKVVGDGTVDAYQASATLLADMVPGPLKRIWNATYADQAAMRSALLEKKGFVRVRPRVLAGVATTTVGGYASDVAADDTTATKAKLHVQMNDTTGDEVYVDLIAYAPFIN